MDHVSGLGLKESECFPGSAGRRSPSGQKVVEVLPWAFALGWRSVLGVELPR